MQPGYRTTPETEEERIEREDYFSQARTSRQNQIQPMTTQERQQSQVDSQTPMTDVKREDMFYIPATLSGGMKAALPWAVGALGLTSGLNYANQQGMLPNTIPDWLNPLAPAISLGNTVSDWYQKMAEQLQFDFDAQTESGKTEIKTETQPEGGPNETPPETPNEKPPKKFPWIRAGLGAAGGAGAIGLGGSVLDNAAGNALEDNADPFDIYNTLGEITSQQLPGFLDQTPGQIYDQTEDDILENLQNQSIGLNETYSNLYAKALENAYRRQAAATSPFTRVSGGQVAQTDQALSAAEIAQLGQIGSNYAAQKREIENMRLAAPQEARAAALEQLSVIQNLTDRNRGEALQIMTIVTDPQYSNEQRAYLLRQFDLTDEQINQVLNLEQVDNRWLGNLMEWLQQYADENDLESEDFLINRFLKLFGRNNSEEGE